MTNSGLSQNELLICRIVNTNLTIKALINDIIDFDGSAEDLNKFNEIGRSHIANLRSSIKQLETIVKEETDDSKRQYLFEEVQIQRQQLFNILETFQKANVKCMLKIEERNSEQLFTFNNPKDQVVQRKIKNKSALLQQQMELTDRLRGISRQLADSTDQNAETLHTLLRSSDNITSVHEELKNTTSHIHQSGRLLNKYQTRDFTDKLLLFFAFSFFFSCVLYVIYCRI